MARTSSVIFDEMDASDLRGEKGISIRYGLFNLGY